jgi:subtilase-type serine protease
MHARSGDNRTDEERRSWQLDAVHAADAHALGYTGKDVIVAVLDDGDTLDHREFNGRAMPPFLPREGRPSLAGSHSTSVSGVIGAARDGIGMLGVAYESRLQPLWLSLEEDSAGDPSAGDAIRAATMLGAKVINGSFGPPAMPAMWVPGPEGALRNPHYQEVPHVYLEFDGSTGVFSHEDDAAAMREAARNDVVMVFAAGNEFEEQPLASANPSGLGLLPFVRPEHHHGGVYQILDGSTEDTDPYNPATYVPVSEDQAELANLDFSDLEGALIAVVAVGPEKVIAPYSNRCGVTWRWCMAAPGGRESQAHEADWETHMLAPENDGNYTLGMGTSLAAPVVSGAAAVLRQAFPYLTARQIIELLLTTTDTSAHLSDRAVYGRGLLHLGRAARGPAEFGAEGFPHIFDVDTRGYDSSWTNDIRGTGGLTKRGIGRLILSGENTYSGPTTIKGGELAIEGSIARSAVRVEPAGTLSGVGVVGAADVAGTVAPGNPGHALRVMGDYLHHAEGTYVVGISPDGANSDRIEVNGKARIDNGNLLVLGIGPAAVDREYTLMHAAGGITGQFVPLHNPYLFLDLPHGVSAGDAQAYRFAVRRNAVRFADMAQTPNQRAVAQGVDSLRPGAAVYDQTVMATDAGGLPSNFDAWSGEIHAASLAALNESSATIRGVALSRARQMFLDPVATQAGAVLPPDPRAGGTDSKAIWAQFTGSHGKLHGDGNAASLRNDSAGMLFGADFPVSPRTRAGASLGFDNAALKLDALNSRARVDSYALAAYGATDLGAMQLRYGAAYAWHQVATRRDTGVFGSAKADYHASTAQLFGEAGLPQAWGAMVAEPYAGLAYVDTRARGFGESGTAALNGAASHQALVFSTLGVRATTSWTLADRSVLSVNAGLGWRHAYGDVRPRTSLAFAGGDTFEITGAPVLRDALMLEAGVGIQASRTMAMSMGYSGQQGHGAYSQALKANLGWAF